MLQAYGADVILTDPMEGSDGAIREARRLHAADPSLFYPDQYNNPANWRAHYETTAPEIWQQTDGRITHFVAGLGTSGTFVGTARRLRELNPGIRLFSVQPEGPLHAIEGLKHMESSIVPGIYDAVARRRGPAGRHRGRAGDDPAAGGGHGMLAGVSSGAALVGRAARRARRAATRSSSRCFPTAARAISSDRFWDEGVA